MAIKVWNCFGLLGGTTRDLDAIPTASLTDQDRAITVDSGALYIHEYDSSGTDGEASPGIIYADDRGAGPGQWNAIRTPLETPNLVSLGNAGASLALDCATYDTHLFTCDQATLTLTFTSLSIGYTIAAIITGGDNCVITWPTEVDWPAGIAPGLSSGTDRVVFQKITSGIIHAALAGGNYA
jgi:hypothetical protein